MQLGNCGGWISTDALDVSGDVRLLSGGRWEGEIALGGNTQGSLLGNLGGREAYLDMTRCRIAGDARVRLNYGRAVNARFGMEELRGSLSVVSDGTSDDSIDLGGLAAGGTMMLRMGRGPMTSGPTTPTSAGPPGSTPATATTRSSSTSSTRSPTRRPWRT